MQYYFVVIFVDAYVESYFVCYCVVDHYLFCIFVMCFDGNYFVFLCVLDIFADLSILLSHVD